MMEKEISETHYYNPNDYDEKGRRKSDGVTFRDVLKEYERDFHDIHTADYALNLYGNSYTMRLLSKSCDAASFLVYGMDLTQGESFDAKMDPFINHEMEINSPYICVYGIDSAFMTEFDEYGYPIVDEETDVYPLTLLVDSSMRDGVVRLAVPTLNGDNEENVIVDVPKFEFA